VDEDAVPGMVKLTDFVDVQEEKADPRKMQGKIIAHYSIPAFDSASVRLEPCEEINSVKLKIPNNCILISRLNPHIYRVWKVSEHPVNSDIALGSTEWAVLKPKNSEELDYIHAILHTYAFKFQFESMVTGTTNSHQRIPKNDISKLEIPNPEKSQRRKIGSVFRTTYELSVRKSNNAILVDSLIDLFSSMFKFKSLGLGSYEIENHNKIPKDWKLVTLGDVCSVTRGLSYQGKELSDQGPSMFNLNSFERGGGYKSSGLKHYSGEFRERHECSTSDILIANTDLTHDLDLIGRPIRVPMDVETPCLFSHHLFRVRINENSNIHPGYLQYWLELHQPAVARWASGSTVNMLPSAALTKLPLLLPPEDSMNKFGKIADMVLALESEQRMISSSAVEMIQPLLVSLLASE